MPEGEIGHFLKQLERYALTTPKQPRALEEEEGKPTSSEETDEWFLGPKARNRGSLHSDILGGFAANIAERGVIAVFPVTGWWKEQKKRDRSELGARYALIAFGCGRPRVKTPTRALPAESHRSWVGI